MMVIISLSVSFDITGDFLSLQISCLCHCGSKIIQKSSTSQNTLVIDMEPPVSCLWFGTRKIAKLSGGSLFFLRRTHVDYGVLDELARGCANPKKIDQHWDDVLRIAGSLKLGTVQASGLIRSLLKSDRPSSLTQAIIEAGRINKTIYLLNYVDAKS